MSRKDSLSLCVYCGAPRVQRATRAMLDKIAATAAMFKAEHQHRGTGFGANINFTLDEMRDLLDEWKEART
jgi:hypothetical protein